MAHSRTNRARRATAGFTLLELLVAVTILASVSALVGVLWAQTRSWSEENSSSLRTLRLPRVHEFLRAQWADRRNSFKLTRSGDAVLAVPESLSFVTATPMLFPDWPIVRVSYLIKPDYNTPPGSPPAWQLVYEETKYGDFDEPPKTMEQFIAEGRQDEIGSVVLLAGMSELRLERFGVGDRSRQKAGSAIEDDALRDASGSEATGVAAVEVGSALSAADSKDEDEARWRAFEKPFKGVMPAVRIVGKFEEEAFSCVFVIEASR